MGEGSTGKLLIFSQVVLSLQLGFAVIPLIHFVSDKIKMGEFSIGIFTKIVAWSITAIIVVLNAKLVSDQITEWMQGSNHLAISIFVVPIAIGAAIFLLYITFKPLISKFLIKVKHSPHEAPELGNISIKTVYDRVAIAVDFSDIDTETIRHALSLSMPESKILIIHVVESAGALILGNEISDYETTVDGKQLVDYQSIIKQYGFDTSIRLGFGNPKRIIPKIVKEFDADLLVMGAHGHKWLSDIIFGTTVEKVRHRLNIPVLIVR